MPGHSCTLQSLISVGCPVQVPPLASVTNFERVLVFVPVPQVAEHSPSFHSSQTQ